MKSEGLRQGSFMDENNLMEILPNGRLINLNPAIVDIQQLQEQGLVVENQKVLPFLTVVVAPRIKQNKNKAVVRFKQKLLFDNTNNECFSGNTVQLTSQQDKIQSLVTETEHAKTQSTLEQSKYFGIKLTNQELKAVANRDIVKGKQFDYEESITKI
eukprot:TRINITY_DN29891_c0_g1_i2.p2 TRINITY_DN29891_c0_g1~~TRINITY_DN29891_c0_g1_i2.p2  ORF type:complete len:157 (-),score=22.75 TRINITY_DN29891_c0_g1_i2:223-693(-)